MTAGMTVAAPAMTRARCAAPCAAGASASRGSSGGGARPPPRGSARSSGSHARRSAVLCAAGGAAESVDGPRKPQLRKDFGPAYSNAVTGIVYNKDPKKMQTREGVHILLLSECNIGRSVIAEAVLTDLLAKAGLAGEVSVESKGTVDHCLGEPVDPKVAKECGERGIVLPEGFKARKMDVELDSASFDLVLAFDKYTCADTLKEYAIFDVIHGGTDYCGKVRLLGEFHPVKGQLKTADNPEAHDIEDALYGWKPVEELLPDVVDEIEAACAGLVERLLEMKAEGGRPLKEVVQEEVAKMGPLDWMMPPMLQQRS